MHNSLHPFKSAALQFGDSEKAKRFYRGVRALVLAVSLAPADRLLSRSWGSKVLREALQERKTCRGDCVNVLKRQD